MKDWKDCLLKTRKGRWYYSLHGTWSLLHSDINVNGSFSTKCAVLIVLKLVCVSEEGSLTIVRRSSTKKDQNHSGTAASCPSSSSLVDDEVLDAVDLDTDDLPAVDTPDACDKAAIRSVYKLLLYS
jgi:hypothetical protein